MKKIYIFISIMLLHLTASRVQAAVSLIINHHQATQGTQIIVPIKVKDFQNIISVQGTVTFNPLILSYSSVQDFGLPGMNFNNFGTTQTGSGVFTFSWYETQLIGQNLPDSAVIFSLKFDVVGNIGQTSALSFSDNPTALEIINASFVSQNIVTVPGSVAVVAGSGQQAVTLIMDTVTAPAGSLVVVSAKVKDFININSLQGTLQFDPAVATFQTLTAFGLPNLDAGNFGTALINSGKLTFSWNDTGFAGLNLPDSAVLFSMSFYLAGTPGQQSNLAITNTPTAIEFTDSLNHVLSYNLIDGFIKISGQTTNNDLIIKADTVIGPQGSQVDVAVRGWQFNNIVSIQGTVSFNTAIATFDTISFYGLTGMDNTDFGLTQINNGLLMYSWSDPSGNGVSMADSGILFTMRFTLVGNPGSYTPIDFINSPTSLECADNTFNPVNTQYISGKAEVSGDASIVLNEPGMNAYCEGDSLHISYIANGIFITGNIFILQLSDGNGNFSNPTPLDTIASVSSGTFNCTLPGNLISGTNYKLRVLSSNPVVLSNETNIFSISEIPLTPQKPVGVDTLCANPANMVYTTLQVSGATVYSWFLYPANAGTLNAADTGATVDWNNSFTGTAYIKVKASNAQCSSAFSDSLAIIILAYPTAPGKPTGDTLLCLNPANSNYTVNPVPNASAYTWVLYPANAGVLTPSGNTAVVNWNNSFTGDAYIKVQATNNICTGVFSDSLKITILTYPSVPDKPDGDTLLCINPPDKLYTTGTVAGATAYVWELLPANAGTLTNMGTSVLINWNNAYFGTATLKVKAVNQICESLFSSILNIQIVNPFTAPNKPFGGDTAFCINPADETYYTHPISGATSYTWGLYPTNAGTLSTGDTVTTVMWNDAFTGTVYLYVSATNVVCNGITSDSLIINIYPIPAPPVSHDTAVCFGMPVPDLTASGTGIIEWYTECLLSPPAIWVGPNYPTGHTATGVYNYCVSQTIHNCQSVGFPVTLTIYALPNPPVSNGNVTVCQGEPVPTLSVTASGTVHWYSDVQLNNLVYTGATYATLQTNPGTYTYYVTQTDGHLCESTPVTVTLTIVATPQAPQAQNQQACFGSQIPNLTATGTGTIKWYSDINLNNLLYTGSSFATGQSALGVYTYYVTQTLNACQSPATVVTLTISDIPPPPVAYDVEACQGQTIPPLTATGSGTIEWYSNATLTLLVHTGSPFNTGHTAPGTYTYYVIQQLNSCTSSAVQVTLTIHPAPAAPVSGGNQQVCTGQSTPALTATGSDTIKWYADAGLTGYLHTGPSYVSGETTAGTYTYYVIQVNATNCTSATVPITLTIHPTPPPPTANNVNACSGSTIPALTAVGTGSIQWYTDCSLSPPSLYTGTTFATGHTAPGVYAYCVTQSVNNCESSGTPVSLTIYETPAVPVKPSGDTLICQPITYSYTTLSVNSATSYMWQLNPPSAGTITVTDTLAEIVFTPGYTGTAYLSVAATNAHCTSAFSDSLLIHFSEMPQTPAQPTGDTIICTNSSTSVYSTTAVNATTYNWTLEPTAAGFVSGNATTVDVNWAQGFTGQAILYVSAANICGNSPYSDTLYITIAPLPTPPIISVNGNILTSSYTTGNHWYFNGLPLPGATGQNYTALQNGYYHVVYTDTNGCQSSSDSVQIVNVNTTSLETNHQLSVFPNPSDGMYHLTLEGETAGEICITVLNTLGEVIYKHIYPTWANGQAISLNLSFVPNGVYYLKVETKGREMFRKVLVKL